ncbi:MAG TPA: ATP-binding protein [Verrucomicrobiae bacterium]|jgi:signal transduction histidine kinase/ActR/RegA family two-component response regulator/PAS domain-containing protein
MNWLRQLPIKRKLNLVVGMTCFAVLAPGFAALVIYQIVDFRRTLVHDTTVLADVLASLSQANLRFLDSDLARTSLQALSAEPEIVAGCLYSAQGDVFVEYTRPGVKVSFPVHAPAARNYFEPNSLVVVRPVTLDRKVIGAIYLRASLQGVYDRLFGSMEFGIPVLIACVLASLMLSTRLQRSISQPILELAETARFVAERRDYTVRAAPQGRQEMGLLTDAFNLMLQQIHEQNEALNHERDLLNTLLDNLPDSIYFKDRQSRYVRVSRSKLENAFNLCKERHRDAQPAGSPPNFPEHLSNLERFAKFLDGKSDADFFDEESTRFVHDEEEEIIRTGTPIIGKVERITLQSGAAAWYMSTKMPWRDKDGSVIGTFGSSKNVTAIKQAEQKLQTQLERLKLLDQITRAIAERQDLHSIFQIVIRRLEEQLPVDFACACMYDVGAHTLTVTNVGARSETLAFSMALAENANLEIDENGLSRCLRGDLVYEPDVSQAAFPFPQRLAAGGLRAVVFAPLQVESQIFGVMIAARREVEGFDSPDCEFIKQLSQHVALAAHQAQLYTALQKAFEELRQSQQTVMQQERLRALGQMASGIAHDINNAIAPVSLYSESLLESEPNLSPRAREYLETIQRSIEDVAHTVARMREFYRPREAQLALIPAQINVLARQVIDLSRARWSDMPQQRGSMIRLAAELAPDLPMFPCVESEIREALLNLVFNAVDAMPDGGILTVRTRLAPDQTDRRCIVAEVSDTGIGMDEETRRRCLEPFYTTKGERGTGLGLAMVYGIVRRHGGDIEIESIPGRGATFRLFFPCATQAAQPGQAAPEVSVPPRQRLLLVDDDPVLIRSLREVLESDGHVVVCAQGGQEGIDTFRAACAGREAFDAVFTDLGMPNVDGRQVASAIKGISPSTPVIMLTGWGERLLAEGDQPAHVDQVLSKPPRLRDLRKALNQTSSVPPPAS